MNMASTSLSLGNYWEEFIQKKIASGKYGSVSEVVREALRHLEERDQKLEALKAHLLSSELEAKKGNVVTKYSIESIINELNEG